MRLHKYRVDFAPVESSDDIAALFLAPAFTWTERGAREVVRIYGFPDETTIVNRWTGKRVA